MSDERPPEKPINPYAAPSSNVQRTTNTAGPQLASRFKRLVARLIDGIVVAGVPLLTVALFHDSMADFFSAPLQAAFDPEALAAPTNWWYDLFLPTFGEGFSSWWFYLLQLLTFILLNTYLLATRGQTLGKIALGLQIVGYHSNSIPPLSYTLVIREGGMTLLAILGILGSIVASIEILFIFGNDRRCLHDYWSSTKVVNVQH